MDSCSSSVASALRRAFLAMRARWSMIRTRSARRRTSASRDDQLPHRSGLELEVLDQAHGPAHRVDGGLPGLGDELAAELVQALLGGGEIHPEALGGLGEVPEQVAAEEARQRHEDHAPEADPDEPARQVQAAVEHDEQGADQATQHVDPHPVLHVSHEGEERDPLAYGVQQHDRHQARADEAQQDAEDAAGAVDVVQGVGQTPIGIEDVVGDPDHEDHQRDHTQQQGGEEEAGPAGDGPRRKRFLGRCGVCHPGGPSLRGTPGPVPPQIAPTARGA